MASTKAMGGRRVLGWLVPQNGPDEGTVYELGPVTLIGADAECDMRLESDHVSGKHAEVSLRAGGFEIRDLDSLNGVRIDGKAIPRRTWCGLSDGVSFEIGDRVITFKVL